jgi:magnesium-protoporphyrin IX monomethyl ester (oxidative) cyclase
MYEIKSNVKFWHMQALRDAGVIWIQPGIESMHDELLQLMNKGVTALINTQVLRWARILGQRVMWNFLCGFPGESDEWYREMAAWLPLIEHLEPPKDVRPVRFDRFSPYHSQAENYGLNLRPSWPYEYIYPGSEAVLSSIAYIFDNEDNAVQEPTLAPETLRTSKRALGGPGKEALRDCVLKWRSRFQSDVTPLLIADKSEDETRIFDTRTIAPQREVTLCGLEHQIHHLLEEPRTVAQLQSQLDADGSWVSGDADIGDLLARLRERKLVHCFGDRYMALALPAPPPPSIGDSRDKGYPAGWVTHEDVGNAARRSFRALDRELAKIDLATTAE